MILFECSSLHAPYNVPSHDNIHKLQQAWRKISTRALVGCGMGEGRGEQAERNADTFEELNLMSNWGLLKMIKVRRLSFGLQKAITDHTVRQKKPNIVDHLKCQR